MRNYFKSGLIAFITGVIVLPVSATINIAKKPLFLEGAVAPNIMFTLDNSDSMNREFLPESIGNADYSACNTSGKTINVKDYYGLTSNQTSLTSLCRSANYNNIFYNPAVTYTPRLNVDGSTMGNATTPTCYNPYVKQKTCTVKTAAIAAGTTTYYPATQVGADTLTLKNFSQCTYAPIDGTNTCKATCKSPTSTTATYTGACANQIPTYACYQTPNDWLNYKPAALSYDSSCNKSNYIYCQKNDTSEIKAVAYNKDNLCKYAFVNTTGASAVPGQASCVTKWFYGNPTNSTPVKTLDAATESSSSTTPNAETTTVTLENVQKTDFSGNLSPTTASPSCHYVKYKGTTTPKKQDTTIANYEYVDLVPSSSKTYDSRVYDFTSGTLNSMRTDCLTNGNQACTYDEELTNYRNWYTYYRSRLMAAQTYIGLAFNRLNSTNRVGFAKINQSTMQSIDDTSTDIIVKPIRIFSDSDKTDFFTQLYQNSTAGVTPLRYAMDRVGQYFSRGAIGGSPWADNPGNVNNPGSFSQCRQSYHILMTDGYWDDAPAATEAAQANVDGVDGQAISRPGNTDYVYRNALPYRDGNSNTLADVAMYYWNRDLVPDILNKVPTTASDSVAVWQHLTQYTVAFGVSGKLNTDNKTKTNTQIIQDITAGTLNWPDPSTDNSAKLDDLWHAAINSRGGFFNASNPTEFVNALNATLREIESYSGSFSVTAANSTSISVGSAIYQAGFLSGWVGRIYKYTLDATTGVVSDTPTKATTPEAVDRNILTWGASGAAATFTWSNLSETQKSNLNTNPDTGIADTSGELRLNYLRGDQANEVQNGKTFRNRKLSTGVTGTPVLGDIINSSAIYVSDEDYGYSDKVSALTTAEEESYAEFDKSSRTAMVYVGANDGMLHGFDADALVEQFAVVPSVVYPKLNLLTSTDYAHEYYVDGSPVVGDAYINSSWKTVLLGSTGAGGKSVFALDITDPDEFAAEDLMWEFDTTNTTYADDMGYSIPHPSIVRLHNGKFVALIANGYNSTNGHAVLFIVDIEDGSVIKAIDTGVGSDNGLSSPAPADKDGDRITDYVYAGDLKGNLWKFDLSSDTVADWAATKLFTACSEDTCSDSNRQPITSKPEAMRHPKGGIMVLFGTGSYFSTSDNAAARIEAIYGVRDYGSTELTRADLLKQKILAEADDTRIVSNTEVDYSTKKGWYLPLVYPDTSTTATGERVVNDVVLSSSKLIVTTLIPSAASSCDPGGNSWLMELEPINGARLNYVVLDINNDGALNDSDNKSYTETDSETGVTKTNTNTPVSGKKYSGLITTPTILDVDKSLCTDDCDTTEDEIKYITNSSGEILRVIEKNNSTNYGRQSWRQIR